MSLSLDKGILKEKDFNFDKAEHKAVFWHSSAHLLAAAVKELYPNAKLATGPAIETGFYYDIDNLDISEKDLEKIQDKMREIAKKNHPFRMEIVSRDQAIKLFKARNEDYKLKIIDKIPANEQIKLYHIDGNDNGSESRFVDLCEGPHIEHTGLIKAIRLTNLSGAYFEGNENNKMLTRIYGVTFPDKELLASYIKMVEEAKLRDHRKLGKSLDLFVFSELVGPGLPLYTPYGNYIRNQIIAFSRELQNGIGFLEVNTPNINKAELFKISGHYDKYKDDMLKVKSNYSDEDYFLKPMNCPQHTQIFASKSRSYRDLPIRYSDFAMLYRDERPGELSGLTRLRGFCQDDGHIFCREDQIESEFKAVLGAINKALETYGLDYYVRLSLRDPNNKEKYLGDDKLWDKAQFTLKKLIKDSGFKFIEAEGEAAFYGPKMDIIAKDALNREWQISTIQLDFNLPQRFELKYTSEDGTEKRPVMIHRALIGSPDRFLGVLIEHFAGKFPLWLSPYQVMVIPVADVFSDYASSVAKKLSDSGIRAEANLSTDSLGKKVREAEKSYYNYVLVVGEEEQKSNMVSIRGRGQKDYGKSGTDDFLDKVLLEKKERKANSIYGQN